MRKEHKEQLEKQINSIWNEIDNISSKLVALAGVGNDDEFYANQKKSDKLCARLDGIKEVLKVMGYTVAYIPETGRRIIVTEKQFNAMTGWDKL